MRRLGSNPRRLLYVLPLRSSDQRRRERTRDYGRTQEGSERGGGYHDLGKKAD